MPTIHCLKPISEYTEAVRLVLQLALEDDERKWVRKICREEHYLHREIHGRARPVAYMVIREVGYRRPDGMFIIERRNRVGILVFSRMESSRCNGWYGSLADVVAGKVKQTQWEMLCLSRCWLDPRIQRGGDWFIKHAASQVVAHAIRHIHYDYLLSYPPAFLDQPWQIRELISYCQSEFQGTLYKACNFTLVRENREGLKTYSYPLPGLTPRQKQTIHTASLSQQSTRRKRGLTLAAAITHEVLFIIKRPHQQRCKNAA
jgi:hypothetical protein